MARIVVVDDERHILRLIEVNLVRAGHETLPFHDPHLALEAARSSLPDLIIIDAFMPRLKGSELHQALQAEVATREIPVIFLLAKTADADYCRPEYEYIHRLGAPFIEKPFTPMEVLALVSQVLGEAAVPTALFASPIPLVAQGSVPLHPKRAMEPAKILVVDDEAHIRRLIQINLERAGYEVIVVQESLTALEMATAAAPDLIIVDFTLRVLNGGEVYERLQQDALTRPIPVIVLGSRAADADVFRAQDEYLFSLKVPCLFKPFDPVRLLAMVQEMLVSANAGPSAGCSAGRSVSPELAYLDKQETI